MKINFYKGDLPASFKATNIIALDSETMGLNPKRDKLCLVQISNGDEVCHLVKIDLSTCLLYTSPSPRDVEESRMPSSA